MGSSQSTAIAADTTTPIKHVVVIFQENVSFDHYFATYPNALNPPGSPQFSAAPGTPSVNGLSGALLTNNPNSAPPFRLDRSQATTCDQDHNYKEEQQAYDNGKADKFVEFTGNAASGCDSKQVMGYYDGNTVTALWNYAQHFAMSDNSFGTNYGPSSVGAIDLVSGNTHGVDLANSSPPDQLTGAFPDVSSDLQTVIGDPQPTYDDCTTRDHLAMVSTNKNVGDLLNAKGITWGWFEGGFRPTNTDASGKAICGASHFGSDGKPKGDYIPHHEPFEYYKSTSNPHHLAPSQPILIGQTDPANHQYDLDDFWTAAGIGYMPAVSFLKADAYQDGHAQYSDPLLEQQFLVDTINRLQSLPEWSSTAVIIAYDDSDGWYDHVMGPTVNASSDPKFDALTGPGACGTGFGLGGTMGQCGYGPRLPLLVISPYAKVNYVDHTVTDLSSILRFIEDNWNLGRIGGTSLDVKAGSLNGMFDFSGKGNAAKLVLDPVTGLAPGAAATAVSAAAATGATKISAPNTGDAGLASGGTWSGSLYVLPAVVALVILSNWLLMRRRRNRGSGSA
jgi:phospholipase C